MHREKWALATQAQQKPPATAPGVLQTPSPKPGTSQQHRKGSTQSDKGPREAPRLNPGSSTKVTGPGSWASWGSQALGCNLSLGWFSGRVLHPSRGHFWWSSWLAAGGLSILSEGLGLIYELSCEAWDSLKHYPKSHAIQFTQGKTCVHYPHRSEALIYK